jgi:hypothetical protein
VIVGVRQREGGNAGACIRTIDWGNLLECIFRRDGSNGLLGERIGIFQGLDDVVLAGQLSNRFHVNARLDTESLEKEILCFRDVRNLLAEGPYSLKLAGGGREIVFVGGHGFGGRHYLLRLAAK